MKFTYRAFEKSGQARSGNVEAPTIDAAREQLRAQGLFVSALRPASAGAGDARARVSFLGTGRRLRNLGNLTRQLAVLVNTGTTVVDALTVCESQQNDPRWKDTLADLRRRVEEGAQLSEAMAAHPACFDPVCRSLVAAGESRGTLGEMLLRLASLTRQQQKTRSAVIGACVYPALLTAVSLGVLVLMVVFVMPRFEEMFSNLGAALPPSTQALMSIGHAVRAYWPWLLSVLAAAVGGLWFWLGSPAGQEHLQAAMVRTPPFARVAKALITARLTRMLGVLVDGRVPLVDALALAKLSTGNVLYARLVAKAEEAVTRGEPVSAAFADPTLIHSSVYEALRSGERTGQVGPVLLSLAEFLDEDNEVVLRALTSVLEPVILIVMGLVIGLVATSMFMPLFDLTAAGGGLAGQAAPGATP